MRGPVFFAFAPKKRRKIVVIGRKLYERKLYERKLYEKTKNEKGQKKSKKYFTFLSR